MIFIRKVFFYNIWNIKIFDFIHKYIMVQKCKEFFFYQRGKP